MPKVDTTTLRRLLEKPNSSRSESLCIANLDYDLDTESLTIYFQKRGTYRYYPVPLDTYVDLAGAASQGTFFNLYIKDKFQFERLG